MIIITKKKIGFALTGSFCTIPKVLPVIEALTEYYDIIPIVSENVYATDTRFMKAAEVIARLEAACGMPVIKSIVEAEPIGPKALLDLLVICPATGNTLAKLAHGITDTAVAMSFKAHRRNKGSVLIGISTNDALSGSAANIGKLMDQKGIFFIPFSQDDPIKKESSAVCDISLIKPSIDAALLGKQLSPILS